MGVDMKNADLEDKLENSIGCLPPDKFEDLNRINEYVSSTLESYLDTKDFTAHEVKPVPPKEIIGGDYHSYYIIRDKKGRIVGEVTYNLSNKPFHVRSLDSTFDEHAERLEEMLSNGKKLRPISVNQDEHVIYLPNPGCELVWHRTKHGYSMGTVQKPGIWTQDVVPVEISERYQMGDGKLYLPNPGCTPVVIDKGGKLVLDYVQKPGVWASVLVPVELRPLYEKQAV